MVRVIFAFASKQGEDTASRRLFFVDGRTTVQAGLRYGPSAMEPGFPGSFIDDLAKRLSSSLPEGLASGLAGLRGDVESNFRSILQSGLAKLDLVTRREFDVQAGVLKRTREKLETLEARLSELQAALGAQNSSRN